MTQFARRLLAPVERLVDALCDPARRNRTMIAVAAAYAIVWTLYAVIAKSSQDLNADMAEMVIWAHEPALGYPKHPPLLAWILAGWFAVFPQADWAYYVLAGVTLGAGLVFAFMLAGVWLDGEKRAAVPLLLAVIPFYNFIGLKWDQNSALIPLWALTTWAFMRSLDTRRPGWAVLTGLAGAAALLTKYWSVFLIAGIALAVLFDRRRNAYFRSSAPWLTALVAGAAVLPHAVWLVRERFPPFTWVATRRAAHSSYEWLQSVAEYLLGTAGYAGVALIMVLLLVRPSWPALRDSWLPRDADRRTAAILFYGPLLLPLVAAAASRTNLLSLWSEPALALLPVMMLASPLIVLARATLVTMAAIAIAITVAVLVASPLVAAAILKSGTENYAAYGRLVMAAVEREWQATTSKPLRLIGGPFVLVSTASFYAADRPSTYANFSRYLSPGVDDARIAREGIAVVCPADMPFCLPFMDAIAARGPAGRRSEVVLARRWLSLQSAPARFMIVTVPPQP
jgi:4-amino-4-deoxy-L-arabinose transferase-like glycosyltransferase